MHRALVGGASMFAAVLLTMAASAQPTDGYRPVSKEHMRRIGAPDMGPLEQNARYYTQEGTFLLTNNQQQEIAFFSSPRAMEVCLFRSREAKHPSGFGGHAPSPRSENVPLQVSWRGRSKAVYPGDCLHFNAARVRIAPAAHLAQQDSLRGSISAR